MTIRLPIASLLFLGLIPWISLAGEKPTKRPGEYLEFNYGQDTGGEAWIQSIVVTKPALRSAVRGEVVVEFRAPGMKVAKALCWQQPTDANPNPWGHQEEVARISLSSAGAGSFVFPADEFPHGPTCLRIFAHNAGNQRDVFELQLYNQGGIEWNQGIPAASPPAAAGMKLVFADDFTRPLSISRDGRGARYNAHKPRFGDFSGWRFSDPSGPNNPFEQVDTYLRIKARKPAGTRGFTGLLASVDMDGQGFWAKSPCYLECRFTAQSAPGTWPAFWTITQLDRGPGDELDIVEAYGGVGPRNPNHPGYSIVSHFWRQTNPDGSKKKAISARVPMMQLAGRSYWSTTFHIYAVRIGREETVYYFDNLEVLRHPSNEVSRDQPHCFLVNYAIGGISGWPIDLERYGDGSDMFVDYIRVFAAEAITYSQPRSLRSPEK